MASKSLTGRSLEEGEFAFELREVTEGVDDPVVLSAANDAKGGVLFDAIRYTEPGEHDYEMVEIAGNAEGVTYDDAVYSIHVSVRDNGAGATGGRVGLCRRREPGVRERLRRAAGSRGGRPRAHAAGDGRCQRRARCWPLRWAAALAALVAGVAALKLRTARAARPPARAPRHR